MAEGQRPVSGVCPGCERQLEMDLGQLRRSGFRCPYCGGSLEAANLSAPDADTAVDVALERLKAVLSRRRSQG